MPTGIGNNLIRQLKDTVLQDVRKATILGTLLVLLAVLVARQVMSFGPPAGTAAPTPAAGTGGSKPVSVEGFFPRRTAGSDAEANPVTRWLSTPASPMSRNLFAVKLELFPPEGTKSQVVGESGGFWDEIAKSLLDQADQQERRQELLSNLSGQAKALRVTSVMMGPKPRAVINGELVGEGDVVAGFRVERIEARRIVVEREGIRLVITMN